VRKCPRKGLGVFTEDFIPSNAFVIEYRGDVLTGANLVAREKKYDQLAAKGQDPGSYMFYFRHDGTLLCVDGTSDRGSDGVGRLINHSRLRPVLRADKVLDANYQPHICLFALDDIPAGTELTFDYGERDKDVVANLPWLQDT
jgi:histone-lysine N-methyltransferase SETD8